MMSLEKSKNNNERGGCNRNRSANALNALRHASQNVVTNVEKGSRFTCFVNTSESSLGFSENL